MAYATYENLKSHFGEERLQQVFAESIATLPEDYFEQRLESAAGYMDSYLARRYSTPIVTTGNGALEAVLRDVNVALALCILVTGMTQRPEGVKEMCDDAKEWLRGVANGDLDLPGLDTSRKTFEIVGDADPLMPNRVFELPRIQWGSCAR